MNLSKKIVTVVAVTLACVFSAFTNENTPSLTFSNEIGSDIVNVSKDSSTFAGAYNEVKAEFSSEKVDAGIDAKIVLATDEDGLPQSLLFSSEDFDWYTVFRPINGFSVGFSADTFATGSYLFVEDDNIASGNLGSDGVTFSFDGIENLTLAVTVPFSETEANFFSKTDSETDEKTLFNFGLGAEYNLFDKATIAATLKNPLNSDSLGFGFYASVTPLDGLQIFAGYSSNEEEGLCDVAGKNLFNASIVYENDLFAVGFDYITTDSDFYSGILFGMNATDNIAAELGVTLNSSYKDNSNIKYVFKPAVSYTVENLGEFKAEVDIGFNDSGFESVCFPVYWSYSL